MSLIESQPINKVFVPNSTVKCMAQTTFCCCYKRIDEPNVEFDCCSERSYSLVSDNTDYICACNAFMCHNVLYSVKPFVCQLCYFTTYNYRYPKKKHQYLYKMSMYYTECVTGIGLSECLFCSNIEI